MTTPRHLLSRVTAWSLLHQPSVPGLIRSLNVSSVRLDSAKLSDDDAALLANIKSGLKEAMKSKDKVTLTVLRSIISEHQYTLLSPTPTSLSSLLLKSITRRSESATTYRSANRTDLAETEEEELSILKRYLSEQMTQEEVEQLARKVYDEFKQAETDTGIQGKKALGTLIKEVNARIVKGSTSGKVVSEACRRVLERV